MTNVQQQKTERITVILSIFSKSSTGICRTKFDTGERKPNPYEEYPLLNGKNLKIKFKKEKMDVIEPSKCPWLNPIVLKFGSLRYFYYSSFLNNSIKYYHPLRIT